MEGKNSLLRWLALQRDYSVKPVLLGLRSHTLFILTTVGIGFFCDLFLYGLIVPILPSVLVDRIGVPPAQVQSHVDALLAAYAASSVINSPISGFIADRTTSRQTPYLIGLGALLFSTALLFTVRTLPLLYIARIMQGASSAFVWTVGLTLCMDTVGPNRLGTTIGTISSLISIGALVAPLVGGTIYSKLGYGAVGILCISILSVDFLMRILVIEKKVAVRYEPEASSSSSDTESQQQQPDAAEANESSPLLPDANKAAEDLDDPAYQLPPRETLAWIYRKVPLLYPIVHSSSLKMAYFLAGAQGAVLGAFDATVPTRANELFGFSPLQVGVLFGPLVFFSCIFGPLGGWSTDRFGTKPVAIIGYAFLAPFLVLLRLPQSEPMTQQAILYGALLGLCGIGIAIIDSPGMCESGLVIDRFYKRNPDFFGEQGPYASSYGFGSMCFSAGLALGPVLAGELKQAIGYGNMNAVLGAIAVAIAFACFLWLGGPPRVLRKLR